jgi:hypothetical protein
MHSLFLHELAIIRIVRTELHALFRALLCSTVLYSVRYVDQSKHNYKQETADAYV